MSWSYGILAHKYETSYSLVLSKKNTKLTRQYEVHNKLGFKLAGEQCKSPTQNPCLLNTNKNWINSQSRWLSLGGKRKRAPLDPIGQSFSILSRNQNHLGLVVMDWWSPSEFSGILCTEGRTAAYYFLRSSKEMLLVLSVTTLLKTTAVVVCYSFLLGEQHENSPPRQLLVD